MIDIGAILTTYIKEVNDSRKLSFAQVQYNLSQLFSEDDVGCIIGTDCSYGFKDFNPGTGDREGYIKAETRDNRILYFKVKDHSNE